MYRRRITTTDHELWDGRRVWVWGSIDGLPAWPWKQAPAGLATRAQLHEQGLQLSRHQDPYGVLFWRSRRFGARTANLYRLDQARPRQPFTPARRAALTLAYLARHQCCRGHEAGHYVDPQSRLCRDCREVPEQAAA